MKKGLSTIVVTLIIILLSLVAVGVVWVVVKNVISEKSSEVGLSQFTLNLEINKVYIEDGNIVVDVTRNVGAGELVKIKFVLSDGENSEVIEKESNLGELGTNNFVLEPNLLIADIKTISVAPVFKTGDGSESAGEITDTYTIKGSLEVEDCIPECTGLECGEDLECGESCGTCEGSDACINNLCVAQDCIPESLQTTCGTSKCGTKTNNCELEVNCGTCSSGKICQQGTCTSAYECLYDTDCSSGKICNYGTCATLTYENVIFNADDFHRRGIEYIDMTSKVGKIFSMYTTTGTYEVEVILFEGVVNKNEIWWEYDFESTGAISVNPSFTTIIDKAGTHSITYIPHSKDFADAISGKLKMKRAIIYADPIVENDYSQKVVVNFNTMPFYLIVQINNPEELNNQMNEVYDADKDLVGRDSIDFTDGHLFINTAKIGACGFAGNPIRINPDYCWSYNEINLGNPGMGVLHEMGHGFGTYGSLAWNGYFNELWASFIAAYNYEIGTVETTTIGQSAYDPEDWKALKEAHYGYNALTYETYDGVDLNGALIGQFIEFADKYSWDLWKKLFRKYSADPMASATKEEKMRFFTKSLAESAKEVTGKQADYDYIVDVLSDWDFPVPN